jgi:AraC-like DNA-binding protein
VTRRTVLPSHDDVQLAIKQINETTGKPPTVLALARHLGLANTTFRRCFPDITTEVAQQRSAAPPGPDLSDGSSRFEKIQRENTELRRAKLELTEHLELAIANIQRLTLDNHHLRQQLHAATNVTHISARPVR